MTQKLSKMLLRCLVWLRRLPYRRGYGIHSPFAFRLVTQVFYNKEKYYAYERLAQEQRHTPPCDIALRDCRLCFRLANDFQPQLIVVPAGSNYDLLAKYFEAGCRRAILRRSNAEMPSANALYYIGRQNAIAFLSNELPTTISPYVIIVEGIYDSPLHRQAWQRCLTRLTPAHHAVTFDLYRYGLIYITSKLNTQHYTINFW